MQAVAFYWWPMLGIASFWSQFQDGLSAAERVFALIDAEPKVKPGEPDGREPVTEYEINADEGYLIEFRRRAHSPTPTREVVLPDFLAGHSPGETIALVGHTGAGKSSVAKLMARFYEFQGGEMLIDGRDIRRWTWSSTGGRSGSCRRSRSCFPARWRDNIRYGRPEATDAESCRGHAASAAATGWPPAQWAWTPTSASAAAACRWASGSWWPWPGWC
jgi:ATP-binding cassette, subfamily B, bacterial